MVYAHTMGLEDVTVTSQDPARLRSVLTPDALAAFEHTLTRGRELLESARSVKIALEISRS